VVAFDEVATEKRARWDPKTNFFLGICREHGHRTSLEFNNEGDMQEVFHCLDDGEIHYAAEVRELSHVRICFRFKDLTVFDQLCVHHGSSVQYAVVEAFLNGSARFFLWII